MLAALGGQNSDGLSASVGSPTAGLAAIALGLGFVIAWLLLSFRAALLLILSAVFSTMAIGRIALVRLGGQTGDVLGASSQVCECLALIVSVIA